MTRPARAGRLVIAASTMLALTACGTTRGDVAPMDSTTSTADAARAPAVSTPEHRTEENEMRIRLSTPEAMLTATLHDNPTARDFASLLPRTLTLRDYASTEKISDLPRQLTTTGAPPGADPTVGDIAMYAPWGNLAIYYRDFGYSDGLVLLGRLDTTPDDLVALEGPVTVELIGTT